MSKAKHTPGPWTTLGLDDSHPGIEAGGGTFSVVILGYTEVDEDDAGVRGRTPDEAKANAHLIAAAPDLLEALKEADESLEESGFNPAGYIRTKIRNAIAKAEVTN